MTAEPLFDGFGPPVVDDEPELSADARRTRRIAEGITRGVHPLAWVDRTVRMHPDAARDASRNDGRDLPLRCGSCWFRRTSGFGYPKCVYGDGARVSHGPATDIRAWWPACIDYEPGDPAVSPDAARWIPPDNDATEGP